MSFKSILSVVGFCAVLSACAGGEPLADGEQSLLIGIPKSADCRFEGTNLKVTGNQNFMGKGVTVRGDVDQSVLICTNEAGQTLQTTDHRDLLRRAPSANAILYTVRPGVNRVSGSQYIRSQQYEFWADFNFSPV